MHLDSFGWSTAAHSVHFTSASIRSERWVEDDKRIQEISGTWTALVYLRG